MGTQKQNGTGRNQKMEIIRLVHLVNQSKRRVGRGLLHLTFTDDGWRIVLPKSLEFYSFLPSGRKLLEMAIYDYDMGGEYYWIPYASPPREVTTPSMRLMVLGEGNE